MSRRFRLVGFLALLTAGCAGTAKPRIDSPRESFLDSLFSDYNKPGAPGASVIVAQDDRVLIRKAYGLGDLASRSAVTTHTSFRLASLTKPFTAVAIMQLVGEGKLSLDESIKDVFSNFPSYGSRFTIRHLLTHTSGITEEIEPALGASETILSRLQQTDSLRFTPGSRFSYNNVGYALLAQIVEKRSGQSFAAFVQEHILRPLRMTETLVCGTAAPPGIAIANGYVGANGSWSSGGEPCDPRWNGPGGISSSAEDVYRFERALTTGALLSPALLSQMLDNFTLNDGAKANYGYGWILSPYRGLERVRHWGNTTAFHTILIRFPQSRLTIIVLTNRERDPASQTHLTPEQLAARIADRLLFPSPTSP